MQDEKRVVPKSPSCLSCPLGRRAGQFGADASAPVVVTILEPGMRGLINMAVQGTFSAVHVESPDDVLDAARRHSAHALLVSPRAIKREHVPKIGRVVAECPGLMPVAVVTERGAATNDGLLSLGAHGVRRSLDLNDRSGWCKLRCLISESGGEVAREILDAIFAELNGANDQSRQFFTILVRSAPTVSTVRDLADVLELCPSTIMSRFYRARLPSPKQYLGGMRLVYASAYLTTSGCSIASVADRLHYSSPQSFGRTVQTTLGMSAGDLRDKYPFTALLAHYVHKFVTPFRSKFESFDPTQCGSGAVTEVVSTSTSEATE